METPSQGTSHRTSLVSVAIKDLARTVDDCTHFNKDLVNLLPKILGMFSMQGGAEKGAGMRGLQGVEAIAKAGAISIKDKTGTHRRQLPHPQGFNKVFVSCLCWSRLILSSCWCM